MASQLDVRLHGDSISIAKKYGPLLSNVVQSKFGCKAEFYGVGSSINSGNRKPTVPPEEKFSVVLEKGLKVSVWKADLTSFQVDAVVNAANDQLQHYGGLAYALSRAGGPVIQQESDAWIQQRGKLRTGDAIAMAGGALPCKKIIHAVGPCLPQYPTQAMVSQSKHRLEKAVNSILMQVEKHGLQSVAIPALSSGLFNFPLQQCAEVIVSTLKEYHDKTYQKKHALREIQLVNNDAISVKAMHSACQNLLSNTTKSYSSAGGSHGSGASNVSTTTVQVNNVTMTLKKGKIEEQWTDVIVNTTSHGLKLSDGQISNAILQKAGREIQNEMDKNRNSGQKSVIVTQGYKLHCKEVYHTLCVSIDYYSAKQILSQAIWECLSLAATKPHKSIAFPAIGTGQLGFSGTDVAKIMTSEMVAFANKHQDYMDIDIVIFPQDNDTFKAFENELKSPQGRSSDFPPSSSQGVEHSRVAQTHVGVTPNQIRLTNASEEETQEAKEWLEQLLFFSSGIVIVHNNFLQYFGIQEFQQLHDEAKQGVFIEEFFDKGRAGVRVKGESHEDVIITALLVEAMLCKAQKDFVDEEAGLMTALAPPNFVSYERRPCEKSSQVFRDRASDPMIQACGLKVVRVDQVENRALKKHFQLKRKQLQPANQRRMYQRIRGQFCNMVSHVGFQREYAPPDDPLYGDGIYFTGKVDEAIKVWKGMGEKYLYFVESQVLTGNAAFGEPGLIVPPPINDDPLCHYDSLKGDKSDISVIFNGHQALPEYIIICTILSN